MTTEATAGNGAAPAGDLANGGEANGSQPGAPWYAGSGYTDEDRVYMENKGWTKLDKPIPEPVLKSYRELERVMGAKANAVVLPQAGDEKGMDDLFSKLGKPEAPEKYALPQGLDPQAIEPEALKSYQAIAHAANMTGDQFGKAIALIHDANVKAEEAATMRFNSDVTQTKEKLQQEMGEAYAENVARGNLAMAQLGLSKDDVADLSEALGVERATRMLMKVGGMLAQHKTVGMDNGGKPADGFVTDKARAAAEISKVKMGQNPQFQKALLDPSHPEHANVSQQWREWNRVANQK